jgi:hypothetical protein
MPGEKGHHQLVDAEGLLRVFMTREDLHKGDRALSLTCALAIKGFGEHKELEYFEVHRFKAHGRFKGEKVNRRWENSSPAHHLLCCLDIGDFEGAYEIVPEEGREFIFKVPVGRRKLDYIRSEKFKKEREASRIKNKNKPKRPHRGPDPKTLSGVRGGAFGFHIERKPK